MESVLDLIQKRQSTRKYLATPVKREDIEKCVQAAHLAPSACNSQPWHFIIVKETPVIIVVVFRETILYDKDRRFFQRNLLLSHRYRNCH